MLPHRFLPFVQRHLVQKIDPLFRLNYNIRIPLVNLSIPLYFFSAICDWVPATSLMPQGKAGAERI
jgi:hypothetical protein